jgi:hypothetical protein
MAPRIAGPKRSLNYAGAGRIADGHENSRCVRPNIRRVAAIGRGVSHLDAGFRALTDRIKTHYTQGC